MGQRRGRVFHRRPLAESLQRTARRHLPTPWDFCCEADLPKSTLLVLVQDADGKIIKKDARELLGLKELDTVFIQGKAKRDKTGNVSILASKFYVADKDSQEGGDRGKERGRQMSAEVDIKQLAIVRESLRRRSVSAGGTCSAGT